MESELRMSKLVIPTKQQLAWQDLEFGMFCHFGINTFCNQEWGDGSDAPELFNPTALDARQWVRIAKQSGCKYMVLTAKHHDGFCLWPTKTTAYSVKSSPWKNGQGDVVKECAEACAEEGMAFGIYVSPWDRHEPCYSDPQAYDDFYAEQLTELLTGYGELVEIWFDGAGSEGREYNWRRIMDLIRQHQPDAMVFNMGAPTIRWVGNEDGVAPYPCWNTAESAKLSMFTDTMANWLPETSSWLPAECDVPIRNRHWFWHPHDEDSLHSLEHLLDIYYRSVGHGATLLLNVAPDDRGLIPEGDAERLIELGKEVERRFADPIATIADVSGMVCLHAFSATVKLNHVVVMEDIAHGERVRAYVLEGKSRGEWVLLAEGSAIGHRKIDRFATVEVTELRIRVIESVELPVFRKMSAYYVTDEVK